MSIAITNTLAKQAIQPSSADNAAIADATAIDTDFAGLLLSQLIAGVDAPSLSANKVGEAATDSSAATETTPQTPQDAAQLLASLGLIPNGTKQKNDTENATDPVQPVATGISLPSENKISSGSPTILPAVASAVSAETTSDTTAKDHADLPATLLTDNKPAKFAVPDSATSKAELLTISAPSNDLPASTPEVANATPNIPSHTANSPASSTASLKIEASVRDQTWASDFGQKIVWLASNDKQTAQLTLNPPQMGPIEISLNLSKDSASAFFVSANPEVRDAIETALPKLREMLASAGIELGQANVGAESFRQQQSGNDDGARQGTPRWMADNAILVGASKDGASGRTVTGYLGSGLVDTFA